MHITKTKRILMLAGNRCSVLYDLWVVLSLHSYCFGQTLGLEEGQVKACIAKDMVKCNL